MLRKLFIACSLCLPLVACGEVEEAIDCRDICNEYEGCFGDEFDQTDCFDACEDQPESEIDTCDACLDGDGDTCVDCSAACAPLAI